MFSKKREKKSVFYYCRLSLLLWIIGIFLFPQNTFASSPLTADNIISLTNQERAKYDLELLTSNTLLAQAAAKKAEDIFNQQTFAHNLEGLKFSQWVKDAGYQYAVVGENLAINFTDGEPLFNAWLASPAHKKNILYPSYKEIGVAVQSGDWFGERTTLVVAIFGSPAVLAEQNVPAVISQPSPLSQQPSLPQFLFSNLSEQYLSHAAAGEQSFNNAFHLPLNTPEVILKNNFNFINVKGYALMATQAMLWFMALMSLVVMVYVYASTCGRFYKKLQLIIK